MGCLDSMEHLLEVEAELYADIIDLVVAQEKIVLYSLHSLNNLVDKVPQYLQKLKSNLLYLEKAVLKASDRVQLVMQSVALPPIVQTHEGPKDSSHENQEALLDPEMLWGGHGDGRSLGHLRQGHVEAEEA